MPSTSSTRDKLVHLIDEVKHFILIRRWIEELRAQYNIQMDENNDSRPLKDYIVPSQDKPHSSIIPPAIEANNFELRPSLLQIVQQNQFSGNPIKDHNLHLSMFVQYAIELHHHMERTEEGIIGSLFPTE